MSRRNGDNGKRKNARSDRKTFHRLDIQPGCSLMPRADHHVAARTRRSRAPRYRFHARGILLSADVSDDYRLRSIAKQQESSRSAAGLFLNPPA
jgi:hypothetical protein